MKILISRIGTELGKDGQAFYWLTDTYGNRVVLNEFVGKKVTIRFLGKKICRGCNKEVQELEGKGLCEDCYKLFPESDLCMMRPEYCRFEEGRCRDEEYAKKWCFTTQGVYFAVTNDVKVGYFGHHAVVNWGSRWINQGATKAIMVAEAPNRKTAGKIESFFSLFMKDKTNWTKMLKGETTEIDLVELKKKNIQKLPSELGKYVIADNTVYKIKYPLIKYPEKTTTRKLDSEPEISEVLFGIKGKYLIFRDSVFSIPAHEGYLIELNSETADESALLRQEALF